MIMQAEFKRAGALLEVWEIFHKLVFCPGEIKCQSTENVRIVPKESNVVLV